MARNGSGVPRFAITTNWAGGEQGINGTAALPLDEWSHVAVTMLDEIWAGAPFAAKPALVKRVKATVDAWVGAGLLTAADGETVLATARKARYAC